MFSKRNLYVAGALAALWLGMKYLLPVFAPFVAGTVIALLAEPGVSVLSGRMKLPRGVSAGIGVSATLLLFTGLVSVLASAAVRQVGTLSAKLPNLEAAANEGILYLQDFLVGLAQEAPEGIRPMLTGSVLRLFDSGSTVVDEVVGRIPTTLTRVIGWVPKGAMGIGTALLSAFLISARLPRLKEMLRQKLPESFYAQHLPNLKKAGSAVTGWLKAQAKLSGITYGIVGVGFLILGIPNALLWALVVAVVDAVPILGTGTVLIPWAVVCLLRQEFVRGVGLLLLCAAAILTRTVLEPRLVGRQLGLDPLVTLAALYLGYRFWGILGLILAPILATVVKNMMLPQKELEN